MNEHSSLVLPAHLLIKQPLGQPQTPSYTPSYFAFSISSPMPLPLGVSLPHLPAAQATCSLCTDEEEPAWHIASGRRALPSQLCLPSTCRQPP